MCVCVCRRIKQQVDQVHTNLLCVPGSREHSQRPPNVASTTSATADSNGAICACQQSCCTRFTLPSTTLLCLPSQPNSQKKATAFQSAASTMPAADVNNGPTNKLTKFTPTCCVFQVRGNTHSSLQTSNPRRLLPPSSMVQSTRASRCAARALPRRQQQSCTFLPIQNQRRRQRTKAQHPQYP